MKLETKNQMKSIGGNAVANAITAALGAVIIGGGKALGGKIGGMFKKEVKVEAATIPTTETSDTTVSMTETTETPTVETVEFTEVTNEE